MKVFDAQATSDRLPPAALADALRLRLAASDITLPPRQSLPLSTDAAGARLAVGAVGTPGRRFLVKAASAAPRAAVRGTALLFDTDGTPLAQFDAAAPAAHAAGARAIGSARRGLASAPDRAHDR